jgi:aminopeptidase N
MFVVGLNEGFASWIEYLAVDKCYPEFDIWTQFVADTFAHFLVPDGLKSSHPIEVPIGKFLNTSFPIHFHQSIFRSSS